MGFWDTIASVTGNGRLDRICRELGWTIDERQGDGIALYFNGDRITPRRTVVVIYPEGEQIMFFACNCRGEFLGHNTSDELLGALLVHNDKVTIGGWAARIDGRTLTLSLQYTALAAGVDAASFKMICACMVKEVAEVEAHLQAKGLL